MLRTFWRFITSAPREPLLRFVLNTYEQLIVGRLRAADAVTAPATRPPTIATDVAIFIEIDDINVMFISVKCCAYLMHFTVCAFI
jgi:hypothetical protein